VGQAADVFAIQLVGAAGEGLHQPGDVEEGGLARTRRPGDGDELAFADVQVERAQRVRLDQVGAVDLGDLAHVEHRNVPVFGDWVSVDRDALGIAELVAAGDHDPVADLGALDDLHRAETAGAGAYGPQHGDVAF